MTGTTHDADVVVVGGGIIGLATAERLTRAPGRSVTVLEAESKLALHQTGRNSGVLHSGIYYTPGSLKARAAVQGRTSMVRFCEEHGIRHEVCGKVVVAVSDDEVDRLDRIGERAEANGVPVERLDRAGLAEHEPHCAGVAALHVASTGIVDYGEVCAVLSALVTERGGQVRTGTRVVDIDDHAGGVVVRTAAGDELRAAHLVNCAGLRSDQVAAIAGGGDGTTIVPFRGEYYELTESRRDLVRNLIYPVPDPSFPFLGVHLTRMIDGSVHAGPNAVLALAREGYRWRDVSLAQLREHATNRGLWALGRRYWRTGAGEIWRSMSRRAFVKALQRLVPDIGVDDLEPSPAGVRAQAMAPDGSLLDDFAFGDTARSVHVINAPSPGATASLEIAAHVVSRLDERAAAG